MFIEDSDVTWPRRERSRKGVELVGAWCRERIVLCTDGRNIDHVHAAHCSRCRTMASSRRDHRYPIKRDTMLSFVLRHTRLEVARPSASAEAPDTSYNTHCKHNSDSSHDDDENQAVATAAAPLGLVEAFGRCQLSLWRSGRWWWHSGWHQRWW